jgi:hypothetical protein
MVITRSWDSAVFIVTGYVLDGPEVVQTSPTPMRWVKGEGFLRGVKRPGREADRSPPSVDFKKM